MNFQSLSLVVLLSSTLDLSFANAKIDLSKFCITIKLQKNHNPTTRILSKLRCCFRFAKNQYLGNKKSYVRSAGDKIIVISDSKPQLTYAKMQKNTISWYSKTQNDNSFKKFQIFNVWPKNNFFGFWLSAWGAKDEGSPTRLLVNLYSLLRTVT